MAKKKQVEIFYQAPHPYVFEEPLPEPNEKGQILFCDPPFTIKQFPCTIDCRDWTTEENCRKSISRQMDIPAFSDLQELKDRLWKSDRLCTFIYTWVPEKKIRLYYRKVYDLFMCAGSLERSFDEEEFFSDF